MARFFPHYSFLGLTLLDSKKETPAESDTFLLFPVEYRERFLSRPAGNGGIFFPFSART